MKELSPDLKDRCVAFYHHNTSIERKQEILEDLKKPLDSPFKKYKAVVGTISLGELFHTKFEGVGLIPVYHNLLLQLSGLTHEYITP